MIGSLRSAAGRGVVRIEDVYPTDIKDLWSAITDPDRLARWYGEVEGELRIGGAYRIHLEGPGLYGAGRIEVCDPPRRLRVVSTETDESWRLGDALPDFDDSIDATLAADGDRTRLVIEATGMPLDKIAFYGAGWQLHAEHLADYLLGREPIAEPIRFEELLPSYQRLAADLG
ncbi:hypothetical protein FOE78_16425 [Microlunatus elymi]|uniref:Activator of Hsp90 ATPase homologue 1/2-like C-terminal domain-containing protein n=1 Tax=Microlunatus elymi TaxID=2596828 RepID=A0A516Q6Q8_9ACTN|nr:hypothetical protein FOE78_16425 [Microlunatus elymi]